MRDNIRIICIDMPVRCKAFTIVSDEFYNIYLNSRHTYEQNLKSLKHELRHINNGDFDIVNTDVDILECERHKEMHGYA